MFTSDATPFCSTNGLPATHYFRYICCCFVSKFCSTNGLPATHYLYSTNGLPATHYFNQICGCFQCKFCSINGLPATHYFSYICCCFVSKFYSTNGLPATHYLCSTNGLPATHYYGPICRFQSKLCYTNGLPATHYFNQICCCLQSKFFSTDQEIWYSLEYFFRDWNHGIDICVWEIFWKQTSDIKEIWSVSAHNSEIRITESKLAMAMFQLLSDVIFVWIFFSEIGIVESTFNTVKLSWSTVYDERYFGVSEIGIVELKLSSLSLSVKYGYICLNPNFRD